MGGVELMKYYKNEENRVYAYELDGSQDHLIPESYIEITEQEAQELSAIFTANSIAQTKQELGDLNTQPTKEELMTKLLEIQQQLESLE